ncbi:uncharacterized protein LOC114282995 [Camellia sinensis]|uniref:uncharacterized protein LOC114282995 n=1 Tax=Camellia sinensis TaxID=4442 RepID=UPI001036457A|nr:uncharacterized protein LOC114282995 [Camellia sinensis]
MIITGDDIVGISSLKQFLIHQFEMKDLGLLSYFPGLEISHDHSGYFLTQAKYISDLLTHVGLTDCKTATTPVDPQTHLTPLDGHLLSAATLYCQLLGSLVYLTVTHPDIAYTVHIVSQFMDAPCSPHYDALIRSGIILTAALLQGSTSSWVILSLPDIARSKLLLLVLVLMLSILLLWILLKSLCDFVGFLLI